MPLRSEDIVRELPGLRRYALALTGATPSADRLVERALERLLTRQARLAPPALRPALFAALAADYAADPGEDARAAGVLPPGGGMPLRSALRGLAPLDRQVLLLVTLAGFARGEVAAMLDLSEAETGRRLLAARESLRRAVALRALVIEDEPLVALGIAQILARMGHEVCGVAGSRREALWRDRESLPGLILADVRLRDGDDGIRIVREIVARRPVPVVFITGHAPALIAADDLSPAVVIGKPFAPRTLEVAVRHAIAAAGG